MVNSVATPTKKAGKALFLGESVRVFLEKTGL
jgi:hypothetical protein